MTSDVTVADRLLLTEQEERELADELLHPAVDVGGDGVGGGHADHRVPYHMYPEWACYERLQYTETYRSSRTLPCVPRVRTSQTPGTPIRNKSCK